MALYAIGDVQGCLAALEALLAHIAFDPARDRLWLAGDLVARGPDSLGVLRRVKALGPAAQTVLGNHDLHLLAAHYGVVQPKPQDRTQAVLEAPDRQVLMDWLRQQPLLLVDSAQACLLSHAGIPPQWSLPQAQACAAELQAVLQGPAVADFLAAMYGNEPAAWQDSLHGLPRLRYITNAFTRMRLLHADGRLDFQHKEDLAATPPGLTPWYAWPNPALAGYRLLFGHWAALAGHTGQPRHIALDTGCVWGGCLSAYRVDDGQVFRSPAGCAR